MRGRGRGMKWRGGPKQGGGGPVAQSGPASSYAAPPPPPLITPASSELSDLKMEENQDDTNGLPLHDPGEDMGEEHEDEEMTYEGDGEGQHEGEEGGEEDEEGGNEEDQEMKGKKRTWSGFRAAGSRNKRKKTPAAKNRRIKKYAHPKNAVMCLNELNPGTRYICEQEGGISQPCCMSVEVKGQKYRGYGSSKQLAKQAAAEAALISFVKPPLPNSEDPEKDQTPWATLVSFAMYKLFNDWREGRVGMYPPQTQPFGTAIASDIKSIFAQSTPGGGGGGGGGGGNNTSTENKDNPNPAISYLEAIGAHLDGRSIPVNPTPAAPAPDKNDPKNLPKPAKQVPEGAASMHPVMVLNQMKPGLQYNICESMRDSKPFFVITSELDGQTFTGEGTNVKKAKLALAKAAILGLYGVESSFEG